MKSKEIRKFRDSYSKYEKDCVFEGYRLAVLFDEKDSVKQYGGRWDADEQTWWMPEKKLLDEVHDNGTLVRDWLNDEKMIMGQYGKFADTSNNRNLFIGDTAIEHTEYVLRKSTPNSKPDVTVRFFAKNDVATFSGKTATEFYTIEDGRNRWNALIDEGYNRIEKP